MKKTVKKKTENITRDTDVVIIGGGASGLAAAIELGMRMPSLNVLLMEKMEKPGRKLRATGSGRCNITNTEAEGYERIIDFFTSIGLVTRSYPNGLVYPYSESAADVAALLTDRAESLGVAAACGEEVCSIVHADHMTGRRFELQSRRKNREGEHLTTTYADHVILATGGKSGPSFGTTGDGYRLARGLGHSIVTPVPALTPVECREWSRDSDPNGISLGGTRSSAAVSLYKDSSRRFREDSKVFEEEGELQFTGFGLSGICIFNMTRHMRFSREEGESLDDFLVKADLFPDGDIREYIADRKKGAFSERPVSDLLCALLKKPLADYVIARSAGEAGAKKTVSELTAAETEAIASCVHALSFHPSSVKGWKEAQVTMGGVRLEEINEESSESKLAEGLYITGELADRDYPCGGFNLSNAWITGLAAADSICSRYKE